MKNKAPPDLPPILPELQNILTEYLICPERLPIHEYEKNQEFWSREPEIPELFDLDRVPCGTTLKVQRDPNTGKITEFREVPVPQARLNAKNLVSLNKWAPPPPPAGVPTNVPFWADGFPDPILNLPVQDSTEFSDLLSIPPGFTTGLTFEDDGFTLISNDDIDAGDQQKKIQITDDESVNLVNLVQQEQDFLGIWKEQKAEDTKSANTTSICNQSNLDIDVSEILPADTEIPILKISKSTKVSKNTDWAVMLDINKPVTDFHERIPEMAIKYDFDLDPFQQQAFLKLEEKCDVFVAAPTSAGKTLIAEYAIALSQKLGTRTIYTSPIKALSNQKYRDFKKIFQDVGLLTGDLQINPAGACLIMTTEILRSMLYCRSEIIGDLEYVIFDEVHYINDPERGHVWEEVLILLPDHVRIILLSATVPNTMEFASWIGMTKRRKVYVVSIEKRPVPLEHFLYTGQGGKSKDERFMIINERGKFLLGGYNEAKTILSSRQKGKTYIPLKAKQSQDINTFIGLINHLQRHGFLPAIVFTFSRAQCDRLADGLTSRSVDLTSGKEKSKIHSFYEDCMKRLKEPDRQLPQILKMKEILKNGIGVHHSGILPMIKEIVEMLFQRGLVKLLFATETFAMGVNMPARTVIFNGIDKWDGNERRELNAAEYIQMAGRAGRRKSKQVENGVVIIRCTTEESLPDIVSLQGMMQGTPQKLESKFRLTYSMLLRLLRVESITVESMMSHSFCEMNHATKKDQLKTDIQEVQKKLNAELEIELSDHLKQLVVFYKVATDYILQWKNVHPNVLRQSRVLKELTPGRILLISHKKHYKKLGILLSIRKDSKTMKVLVLADQKNTSDDRTVEEMPDEWYRMLSFAHEDIFQPEGFGGHVVLDVSPLDISLTSKTIKIDCDLVLKDWDKRQIERFRDDPPGQTCQQAIQELLKLTNDFKMEYLHLDIEYRINEIELCQDLKYLDKLQKDLTSQIHCTKIANFEEQFLIVFKRKYLEEKLKILQFKNSNRSLSLYPDYMSRINILKQLRYIDDDNRVLMKGTVACEIGMNELLITELVLRNTLSHLEPAEVAALLSALVFQVKVTTEQSAPNLPEALMKGMNEINNIHLEIKKLEDENKVQSFQDELNFGLVKVVYEWAKNKPFADIMQLTEVQEGIIVRCIQQLNETISDVRDAALIIGDPVLKAKMEDASSAIKRDIVFAASLYT